MLLRHREQPQERRRVRRGDPRHPLLRQPVDRHRHVPRLVVLDVRGLGGKHVLRPHQPRLPLVQEPRRGPVGAPALHPALDGLPGDGERLPLQDARAPRPHVGRDPLVLLHPLQPRCRHRDVLRRPHRPAGPVVVHRGLHGQAPLPRQLLALDQRTEVLIRLHRDRLSIGGGAAGTREPVPPPELRIGVVPHDALQQCRLHLARAPRRLDQPPVPP